ARTIRAPAHSGQARGDRVAPEAKLIQTAALAEPMPARMRARAIRGVLYAQPSRPSGPAMMIPPSPCARSRRRPTAATAAERGEAPSRTRMQAARAIETFRIASPRPVELAAAS